MRQYGIGNKFMQHLPGLAIRLALPMAILALALIPQITPIALASHPLPILNMTQLNSDDSALCAGCTATTSTVKFTGESDAATCGASNQMQIEVQLVGSAFTGTPNYSTTPAFKTNCVQQPYPAITVSGLANGSYKWQAREFTDIGGAGMWTQFNRGSTAFIVGPTAVNVMGFRASVTQANAVILKWQTVTESKIAGFEVYRKTSHQKFKRINPTFIQAKHAGDVAGAKYRHTDTRLNKATTYRYRVQVFYLDGHKEWTEVAQVKTR